MHHANLIIGSKESLDSYLKSVYKKLGIRIENNPDYFPFNMETFGIDEARELSLLSQRKAFKGQKVFVITPEKIAPEAQNALLKTFEEPYPDTYFFLLVKEEGVIIPTLRSGMRIERIDNSFSGDQAKKFLSLSIPKRILFAKSFQEDGGDIKEFLDNLMLTFKKDKEKLLKIYRIREKIYEGAFSKLVLEHLSLVL